MPRRADIAVAIERIGKYAAREPWLTHRRAYLESMLARILERYDLDLEALFSEIYDLGQVGTLAGFIDESFLAAECGPDKTNVIDDYLRRRGWQETPRAREYLQGIRSVPVSLYEVHDVVPGEWLELKDRYRGGPPTRVYEASGSRSLQRWDRIAARVVAPREEPMLTGGVLFLTRDSADALEGVLTRVREKGRRAVPGLARKHGVDLELIGDVDETLLRVGDRVFLQFWLKGLLDFVRRPPPQLANTDGDALLLSRTQLPMAAADAAELIRRMDALDDWTREQDDAPGWHWQPGHDDARRTIHATARIDGEALVVETNSCARMERALTMLRATLGELVGQALTSHEDPAHLLRHAAPGAAAGRATEAAPAGPEIEAMLRKVKDDHYRRVLDEPVPMLGDRTPRECARTKPGRARLVRWLKEIENGELRGAAASGQAPYDTAWMWQELGVRPE